MCAAQSSQHGAASPLDGGAAPRSGYTRQLWRGDHDRICDHFRRLTPGDRLARFAHQVDESGIDAFCRQMSWLRMHLLGHFLDGGIRGLGELRLHGYRWPITAELALSVERAYQNRGIGTELFGRLLLFARNRGVRAVWMQCRLENLRMRRIAVRFGARIALASGDVEGSLSLPAATPFSLLQEAQDEVPAIAGIWLDLLGSWRRPAAPGWPGVGPAETVRHAGAGEEQVEHA